MLSSLLLSVALLGANKPVAAITTASPAAVQMAVLPTPQFRRYGTSNGLPSSSVYTVVQGHDGVMWFATKGGIARYDGVDFKVFRHVAGDSGSLYDNGIGSLLIDRAGRLWAGGLEAGLNRYDAVSGKFEHWGHDAADPSSMAGDKVWSIAQSADGSFWVGHDKGLDRMRADGHGFEHISDGSPAGFGSVVALYVDAQQRLWFSCDRGIFRRDPDGRLHHVVQEGTDRPIDAWRIEGDGEEIRIATGHGLLLVGKDDVARLFAPEKIPDTNVISSARDQAGRLWIGTQRGLFLQNSPAEPVVAVLNQPMLTGNLPGTWVWKIFPDREGGLWITLFDGGVAYLAPGWNKFSRFTHIPDDDTSLRDSMATAMAHGRDGRLWVGQRSGRVDKLDPTTGMVEHILSIPRGDVLAMTEDADRRLWIIMQGALYRYAGGKLDMVDTAGRTMLRPLEVELGPDDKLYARTFGEGLFRVDQDTLASTPVPIRPAEEKARWCNQLTLKRGIFWYASDGGLWRLAAGLDHLEPVPGVSRDSAVNAFDFGPYGMWLARPDGLEYYRYENDGLAFDHKIGAAQGWPSVNVLDLAVDEHQRLWLFGRDGLWRYDPSSGRFRQLDLQDGLSNSEFFRGFARLSDSHIYAPTLGGVIAFDPNSIDESAGTPLVAITGVSVRRKGVLVARPLRGDASVSVSWQDRGLMIEARVSSYVNPAANRYRFRLNGFDADWVDTGNLGAREFAGLSAGDYTLDVMAAGADGAWGQLSAPLTIHVQAPPWARWWAWCAYALLVALLTWLVLRVWRRRLAQRHQMQLAEQRSTLAEQASAAKTRFLANLSHEIRTPMTGVLGMAELLLSTQLSPTQHEYTETMRRSGGMLLKLLNDALDLARIEAGRLELEPSAFDPHALIYDVARLERGLAQAKGLRFHVDISTPLPAWLLGDAVRIKQILLNLANNALKFTEHGSVTLRAKWSDEELHLSISDTGPGIPEASQARLFQRFEQEDGPQRNSGSGLGLAICRELVGLMGGSIELQSRVAHGSTFHVRLPLSIPAHPAVSVVRPVDTAISQSLRLLLVEDDATVAAVIRGLLERQGHVVLHVGNGLSALAELEQTPCDAVFLDLDLPGVDGFQIAQLIRQGEDGGKRMPIIAVTARSGGDEEPRSREAGMDGFLRKPLTGEQLVDVLSRVAG
ncbi:hybrid sensor histidine kinase/response regulator [Dyella tabacisoli]|uniref:histidine kinase n=1 Tax=Dyella tabacisoli TaxID=2282381 RepID=A0A369UQ39_9GAMM|nr:hybrid sensor histidine kinase/response regulator [Dyella tabacisoli]RDD82874.1 response regulator [Dyella tabacisoli]